MKKILGNTMTIQTITTEEEIEEIEEILQCSTVNYTCSICKIEINEVENQDEAGSINYYV